MLDNISIFKRSQQTCTKFAPKKTAQHIVKPPHLLKQILLASFTYTDVVLRTLFCFSQNARGAICTCSLTNKFVASLNLIIRTAEKMKSPTVMKSAKADEIFTTFK